MGDLNSSDSSWKKMVIVKTNDEWTSTRKNEQSDANQFNCTNFSIPGVQIPIENIKKEKEDVEISCENLDEENFAQAIDPFLDVVSKQRRKKGSGPKRETLEERSARLARMSAYAAHRLANETPEQRAARLKRMSEYAARRLAQETSEQRARRLARMSAYAAKRLANESPEQRQMRLIRMSAYAAKRQAMKKATTSSDPNSDTFTDSQS